jgi:hypothetical protein
MLEPLHGIRHQNQSVQPETDCRRDCTVGYRTGITLHITTVCTVPHRAGFHVGF